MGVNSCLYECSVMHHRLAPKEHHFNHNIFMFYLDLDEVDSVAKKALLFGRSRWNFYSFRDEDHLPEGEEKNIEHRTSNIEHPVKDAPSPRSSPPAGEREKMGVGQCGGLKKRVVEYLARNGIDLGKGGRIMLLTLPRVLGYVFNPVSFYFCFDSAGAPMCAIAEVGNTFREMKLFLLDRESLSQSEGFKKVTPKRFYVSPFSSLALSFDFRLRIPGEQLNIHIDDREGDEKVLLSTLSGKRAALTNSRLWWFSLKYPLVTLKVISLIHWHALLLYLKKVPFYRKAANPTQQCDVLNPHPSLTGRTK